MGPPNVYIPSHFFQMLIICFSFNTMFGEFTDLQMFGRTLTSGEMIDITGCDIKRNGDIISWESEEWILNGTKKTSKEEILNFEEEVCRKEKENFLLIPFKQKGLPFGIADTCEKLTGKVLR